jgi:D-alanine-D-alanine ligase
MTTVAPLRIPRHVRDRLRVMFIAKHARGAGSRHEIDGDHAVYHHEITTVMQGLFANLTVANRFEDLFEKPQVDYIFSLLNRGGFLNSEMLAPLLATRHGIPFLGASPILRGLADDKHLMKMAARFRGVPTADWQIYRRGAPVEPISGWSAERYVVKPNASSASWGVAAAASWDEVRNEIARIHEEGHDALVEPFLSGIDVEIPVIGGADGATLLPIMTFQHDPEVLRTYEEKRGFSQSSAQLVPLEEGALAERLRGYVRQLIPELWPFDYGRFEFRTDVAGGDVKFLEVNLQANIWSRRVIGQSARLAGLEHPDLIETVVCSSLIRHGLVRREDLDAG